MRPIGRFVAPVGTSSLIIARCDNKHSVCLVDDLDSLEDKGSFHLILGNYALKSSPKSQQILVNFEKSQGNHGH